MLAPPKDLTEDAVVAAIARGWGIEVAGLEYRPVGFGSHHWESVEAGGARWFITVDVLDERRVRGGESRGEVLGRLSGALGAARALANAGMDFVVAPVPALDGEIMRRLGPGFAVAIYPLIQGESFEWGPFRSRGQLDAVLRMLVAVHGAPSGRALGAPKEDLAIQMREELESALADGTSVDEHGPFALPLARLLSANASAVRSTLHKYDELVFAAGASNARMVLTHGEPHAGNTMHATDGWKLIDWDTAAVARPERDLWDLDPGDGSVLAKYADATGHLPDPKLVELYRLRWDLADLSLYAAEFRREHADDPNSRKSWEAAQGIVHGLTAPAAA